MTQDEFNQQQQTQHPEPSKPFSDLEFSYMTIDPSWGKEVTAELRRKLQDKKYEETFEEKDEDGKPTGILRVPIDDLWSLLAMYTKDVRLGNLDMWGQKYVEDQLDLASDCLALGYIRSFTRALSRAITKLEVSQSRGGFLRKRSNTFTKEQFTTESKAKPVKDWLGRNKE
jgi:hypothetical protein